MPGAPPAGLRVHAVTVELPTPAARTGGDVGEAFAPSGGPWWVAIAPAGGREHAQAATSIGQATHTITGLYRADVSIHARLVHTAGGTTHRYNVVGVEDPDLRHESLIVRAQEVVA